MIRARIFSVGEVLPLLLLATMLSAWAQTVDHTVPPADPVVTSDSSEYCGVLLHRITGLSRTTNLPPPLEAAVLSEEGERMCIHGQTRGGVMRLRRALAILRHSDD